MVKVKVQKKTSKQKKVVQRRRSSKKKSRTRSRRRRSSKQTLRTRSRRRRSSQKTLRRRSRRSSKKTSKRRSRRRRSSKKTSRRRRRSRQKGGASHTITKCEMGGKQLGPITVGMPSKLGPKPEEEESAAITMQSAFRRKLAKGKVETAKAAADAESQKEAFAAAEALKVAEAAKVAAATAAEALKAAAAAADAESQKEAFAAAEALKAAAEAAAAEAAAAAAEAAAGGSGGEEGGEGQSVTDEQRLWLINLGKKGKPVKKSLFNTAIPFFDQLADATSDDVPNIGIGKSKTFLQTYQGMSAEGDGRKEFTVRFINAINIMAATGGTPTTAGGPGTRIDRKDKKGKETNMCSGRKLDGTSCIDRFIVYLEYLDKKTSSK